MERVRFVGQSDFYVTLKRRVDQYFDSTGLPRTGTGLMFFKTCVILMGMIGSYVGLVFVATSPVAVILGAIGMALCTTLMGFNVMHDGAHGAYSSRKWVNWVMGYTLDLMGGSNYLWRQKHNLLHHTYTNIDMLDRDLQSSGLMRLSPDQAWRPMHRYQHWYALPLYGLHTFFWALYRDFLTFFSGKAGPIDLRKPTVFETVAFLGAKLFYFFYALILPALFHPFWLVGLVFFGAHLVMGVILSLVFQLAHTTEGPVFPAPDSTSGQMDAAWAIHQVETTANFAPQTRWVTWCVGGLNFQIEHHLFSHVCHIHYPAIGAIVKDICRDYGVVYHSHPTLWSAIRAHFRFLKKMAQPTFNSVVKTPSHPLRMTL